MRRLAIAAVLAVVAALVACTDQPRDGYTWSRTVPALSKVTWHVMSAAVLQVRCGAYVGTIVNACVEREWGTDTCHIYSWMDEATARAFKPAGTFGGTTLYQHEVWDDQKAPTKGHCAGFDHKESHLSAPGEMLPWINP